MKWFFVLLTISFGFAIPLLKFPAPQFKPYSASNVPCSDLQPLDKNELNWNDTLGPSPWSGNTTTVFSSALFKEIFTEQVLRSTVPGLAVPATFQFVFNTFRDAGCFLYPHGGCVRDILLGLFPRDIDVEYSCSTSVLNETCITKLGPDVCNISGDYYIFGNITEPWDQFDFLEGVSTSKSLFGRMVEKEYTTNTIYYDVNGYNLLYDLTGTGVLDTCKKIIRIPVEETKWEDWRNDTSRSNDNGLKKVARAWKLRAVPKLFKFFDEKTEEFLVDSVVDLWTEKTAGVTMMGVFRKLACSSLNGNNKDDSQECIVDCKAPNYRNAFRKRSYFFEALRKDVDEAWFNDHIIPILNYSCSPLPEPSDTSPSTKLIPLMVLLSSLVALILW